MSALLEAENIAYAYGSNAVLQSVGFSARGGEFVALLGLNGAGKSTLLDILAGLCSAHSGVVRIEDRDLLHLDARERARWISHLPQGIRSELPFTVEQIVLMGRYAYADGWFESGEDRQHAIRAMEQMDCLRYRERAYHTLSGGERQRVLLAACLAQEPKILLFDEPSTYLDVHQQLQCFTTLAEVAATGALCIAVTHDLNLALAHCTRLLVLHEGRLAADILVANAKQDPGWLGLLSPRLRLVRTDEGRPWVLYQ
jgi:ABC-type cobalamin/Fe3+-siderophores transport system ATPase subunit